MINEIQFKKTPFWKLLTAGILGVGTSIAPVVLLGFGLIQFKIMSIVGPEKVTEIFGKTAGTIGVVLVIITPIMGIVIDKTNLKFGRRRFWIVVGSILGGMAMVSLSLAKTIPVLVVSAICVNLFYGIVSLNCYAIVPEQADPNKFGRISGLFGAAAPAFVMTMGMIFGLFASSTVPQKLYALMIIQLIGGMIAVLLINDGYRENQTKEKVGFSGLRNFYPSFKKYPEYTWALLTKLFINMSNAGIGMLTLFYIARFHLSEKKIFELMGLTSISIGVMVIAGIIGGFLSDKVKKQKPFVIGAAIVTGLCLIAFAFSKNITWVIIGNFIFNFGFGLYNAVDQALVNRILPNKENISKDLSIMNITTQISGSLVNFIAPSVILYGTKFMKDDGYTFFFIFLATFSILSALAVIPIPEISKKEVSESEVII